ncbi:hypothetical protein CP8484711_0423B, partial [Chlamydia psittaci 84-8471/1]
LYHITKGYCKQHHQNVHC